MNQTLASSPVNFVGQGPHPQGYAGGSSDAQPPWWRHADEPITDLRHPGHPYGYLANDEVVQAVNTALILGKPLLLTGSPGTGKTDLAERIAWELGLGAVERYEAQSQSDAQDLFYRFDLVGQMAAGQLGKLGLDSGVQAASGAVHPAAPQRFLSFGPLGKAILQAKPDLFADDLRQAAQATGSWQPSAAARRSVVLIDEIDKASRDFPNDLLNGIERMAFRVRELGDRVMALPLLQDGADLRPIVIITSNQERELPAPFLRRCVFVHVPDPSEQTLRLIVRNRVFGQGSGNSGDGQDPSLLEPYETLLKGFKALSDTNGSLRYRLGTTELIDWFAAIQRDAQQLGKLEAAELKRSLWDLAIRHRSALAKHRSDREPVFSWLQSLRDQALAAPVATR